MCVENFYIMLFFAYKEKTDMKGLLKYNLILNRRG